MKSRRAQHIRPLFGNSGAATHIKSQEKLTRNDVQLSKEEKELLAREYRHARPYIEFYYPSLATALYERGLARTFIICIEDWLNPEEDPA